MRPVGKLDPEERADSRGRRRRLRVDARFELARKRFERVEAVRRQLGERRQPRRHRQRIGVERSAVADAVVSPRVEQRHHVGAAAERADRQPAADDLAQRGQVGRDAVATLRAVVADAEGDDLVEDEQRARVVRELSKEREELVRRRHDAARPEHRLDDHRRQIVQMRLERSARSFDVVEGRDDKRLRDRVGNARTARRDERRPRECSPRSRASRGSHRRRRRSSTGP